MKIKRQSSMFETSRRRPALRLPIIPIALVLALALLLAFLWSRGGEKPLTPVEKPIAAEKLGR